MKARYILFILILMGCEKVFFEDDPANSPESNFEIFWTDFDQYYSQFAIRSIDWDQVYNEYRPTISANSSDEELYNTLSEMVTLINDMHVSLYTPLGNATWQKPYPAKYPSSTFLAYKLNINPVYPNAVLGYGKFGDHEIGYIQILDFSTQGTVSDGTDPRYKEIDHILSQLKGLEGIIIDVRRNGGGNSSNAELIASRFADQRRLYALRRYKNDVGSDDFSEWKEKYIEPDGEYRFTKPVVVLTSRMTSSSAESFVMAMSVFSHVTVVGDTTGGGIGSPIRRELPNGWNYRLSTSYTKTTDGIIVDGHGIPPDFPILTSASDSISGTDRICEKGIEIILGK